MTKIPVFELKPASVEEWNYKAGQQAVKAFREAFGYEPESTEAALNWLEFYLASLDMVEAWKNMR